jgi:multisubunit Na+/H+ antiporter MnhC subunit
VSRRRTAAAAILLPLALLLAGCDEDALVVSGIVVAVQQSSPAQVQGFTLRNDAGQLLVFEIGELESGSGSFPAVHLRDHLASASPIAVRYVVKGERLIVMRMADAP